MSSIYKEIYNSKKLTVKEVLSKIKSNDEIAISTCAMEPLTIVNKLHTIKESIDNVNIWYNLGVSKPEFLMNPILREKFTINSWFFTEVMRKNHRNKNISYQPAHLHNAISRRLDYKPLNVFIGSATPMDEHGYIKSSLSLVFEKEMVETADLVIMEINPNMPIVNGDTEIHINDVDYIVEVNTPIPILSSSPITSIEKSIGQNVAKLVKNGDTIQLGIGAIPDAVAQAFINKKDLGVHTEMITNSIVDLVEAGIITNKKKTYNKGKIVGAFAFGNKRLYNFLNNNPTILMKSSSYCNNPINIARNDNMVSINSCIQVDLTGQISSESIGTRHYSGTGGQNDTATGAIHAKNGRSIIALRSTAKEDTISTIQPFLSLGSAVTMSRNDIDYIVTEYGIASMKGRTICERVNNLIEIAHPNFREQLRKDAEKFLLW